MWDHIIVYPHFKTVPNIEGCVHYPRLDIHFTNTERKNKHGKQQCKQNISLFIQQTRNKQVIGYINHQSQIGHFYKSDVPALSGGIILVTEKMPSKEQQSPAN